MKQNLFTIFLLLLIGVLIFFNFKNISKNKKIEKELVSYKIEEKKIKINRNYFNNTLKLKDYSNTKFKITDEGKKIIENIRKLHKTPVLVGTEYQNKEVCAGYIWNLSEKIWGKKAPYSIGMENQKERKPALAWELPYFYEAFGGKVLFDISEKFSLKEVDYIEKITLGDMKSIFSNAFSEKALLGDIGFLYSKTKYTDFLRNRSYNSHITKNIGVLDFEIVLSEIDKNKSNLDNFLNNLGCNSSFLKYINLLENYKIFLNNKRIIFYKGDFYYLIDDKFLGDKIRFKYLDKIKYFDISLAHFFEGKSYIDSLFKFTCNMKFYPINVISINSRMIEKM